MIGLKGIAKRSVFVIDKDGIVRHREVLDDARNEPDYQKVFDTLASLALRPRTSPGPRTGSRDSVPSWMQLLLLDAEL